MTFRDDPAGLVKWLDRLPPVDCAACDGSRYVTRYVDGFKQLHRCLVCIHQPPGSSPVAIGARRPWRDFITETPCCSQGFVVRRIADCEWVMVRCPRCGDNSESAPLQQVGQNSNTLAE